MNTLNSYVLYIRITWHAFFASVNIDCICCFRYNHGADDDHDQHRSAVLPATDLLRESHRHLPRDVLCLRVRRPAGVRSSQLHILGGAGEEKEERKEAEGN